MNNVDLPLFESPHDYVFTMTSLNSAEAKRQWRAAIKQAWTNRCAYCGQPPIDDKSLTIDHVRPKSKGGQDCTSNVIPACRRCNGEKGSSEWIGWYRMQPFYTIDAELRIKKWLDKGLVEWPSEEDSIFFDELLNQALT